MGYYTRYHLSLSNDDAGEQVKRFLEYQRLKLRSLSEVRMAARARACGQGLDAYLSGMEALEDDLTKAVVKHNKKAKSADFSGNTTGLIDIIDNALHQQLDACKWYGHEDDMKVFSSVFPDALLTLRGEGEEAGDLWVKYFKAGKVQVAKAEIKFEDFDPKKLK